jgi:hypothetical protein
MVVKSIFTYEKHFEVKTTIYNEILLEYHRWIGEIAVTRNGPTWNDSSQRKER